MKRLPLWSRKFIVDFVETVIPSFLVFNWLVPSDALTPALVTALATAGLSAARRNLPEFNRWLRDEAGVEDG